MLEARPRTTVVDLNPLNADDPLIAAMEVQFAKRGFSTERYFRFGNWYLPLEQRSSAEYLKSLPGQVRSTLQRKGKKLRATPNTVIRVVTDVAEVPAAMDAYESVYRSSWKVDEPHKDFIRAIVSDFARRGWLRLGLIEIGSRPAAAQIWFVYGGTASIFKLAYDEEFAALSVGSALTLALMQHVIDLDCVATVDYLCGDDSYKRDWMSTRRERIGLRAIRRVSLTGALDAAARVARRFRRKRSPS
jgi:ribosomal protein S18 acetylase RimI-like enzyme